MTVTKPSALSASALEIEWTKNPKTVPGSVSPEVSSLKATTDHMITASWSSAKGWDAPKLTPYGPIPLLPSANVLHYGTACFEGMKVYRGFDGRLRLHRPLSLGLWVPEEALLYIFLIYWPSLNPSASPGDEDLKTGIRLLGSSETSVRAWPGGTGAAKVSANYGPTIQAHGEARKLGYDQVLWLFGPDRQITEAGSANMFVIWKTSMGTLEMVTPPLDERKIILAGGTRRSILELSRKMFASEPTEGDIGKLEVVEREITMSEVVKALDEERLMAAFVVGTAAWIQPVAEISFDGQTLRLPVGKVPHVLLLKEKLQAILYGKEAHPLADIIDEE
ncbi:branched-chain amino acid cytosolic [Colletotrichum truncatum]|uniref:Branched-chain amino acid cytosolic n=1 Tax=Colletotrichum truncatum TaxID=5467 RepID=A0ACC3YP78_COLTU|nr:branched-chain amino acid cytosolic [Colletotrichum truncatum]KAF6784182.1 branched-chain amino acid cytosolic [Colletotrichum truncatum]